MQITPALFEAFLKCPTKCWLWSQGETDTGNEYAAWVKTQSEAYRIEAARRLAADIPPDECATTTPQPENLKSAKWRFALDVVVNTRSMGSTLHAVERVPSEGRGKAATFIPIRFMFTNKLTRDDKLLVGFDSLVLSEVLGRDVGLGKIVHGENYDTLKVKTSALVKEVRKGIEKAAALLCGSTPPDLILNRHCGECEFQTRCRQKAIEKDDLSLLAGMNEKERRKFHSKGIFTVTQLSYTFRPRRRPKRLRDKKEKYHHSLKALAIREKKIHIVGTPELKIDGTSVYLDVEGLPDRDFYYLIGVRIGHGETAVQHSLWADTVEDEGKIWREFLAILETVEKPVLIHYGSYETHCFKKMRQRHGEPLPDSLLAGVIKAAVNLLTIIFAQVFFPTFSNGLKEIAEMLGFKWSDLDPVGSKSITWRRSWEHSRQPTAKAKLITYNAKDCAALALVENTLSRLTDYQKADVVHADALTPPFAGKWRVFSSPLGDLEFITKAAHWDYQRDRILIRSPKHSVRALREISSESEKLWRIDKVVSPDVSRLCPRCHQRGTNYGPARSKIVQDLIFGRNSLKRRVIRYDHQPYWCPRCKQRFGFEQDFPKGKRPGKRKYGRNLLAFLFYQIIELGVPQRVVIQSLHRLFGLDLNPGIVASFKETLATDYAEVKDQILRGIVAGGVVHVDETHITIKRARSYVWVFTSLQEVAYVYSETREGDLLHETLKDFKGVVVSDFYAVYDSLDCPQQKCLIHLVRDLNEVLLKAPYDEELKALIKEFGGLLKTIVEEIDRRGLKKYFLRKHFRSVDRFYRKIVRLRFNSPAAVACQERLVKNRDKLFTFLNYDGVSWNNNNAEHAIKAFSRLREFIESGATVKGIREYLILLSVCQTCKYSGVDFLDFLRSGEKDIHAFADSRRRRKSGRPAIVATPTNGPTRDAEVERPF